jgi:hypothetical protein
LTGWRLDIISKSKLQKRTQEATFNLQHIEGVNETIAQGIYQAGYHNIRQVAEAAIENLQKIPGYDTEEAAQKLKERAQAVVEKAGDLLAVTADSQDSKGTFTANPAGGGMSNGNGSGSNSGTFNNLGNDAKSMAEERLREMMKSADNAEAGKKSEA